MTLRTFFAAAALAVPLIATPVLAGPATDVLRGSLYRGTLSLGLAALQPMAAAGDQEAKFGVGVLTFFTGFEGLFQALYRHGLAAPDVGPMGPAFGVPIPANATPEALDYEKFRAVMEKFVADLDAAQQILLEAGEGGEFVAKLDPLRFRIDVNGDGRGEESESVAGIFGWAAAGELGMQSDIFAQPGPRDKSQKDAGSKDLVEPGIGFDKADAVWLAGYSNVIAAQFDFFLAHDFSEFFNSIFHRFFPRADLPMQEYARGGVLMMDPDTDTAIMDAIAAIHTLNWPVTDSTRLQKVLTRLQAVTQLSRRNWALILDETDDDAELIPSPRQTPLVPDARVTAEMVDAWHKTLDAADRILAGELLVPHWRFRQGFDLNAYFTTATRTDLVMILTGYGALPFLRNGPIADAATFGDANRVFGNNLLGYAFWFN